MAGSNEMHIHSSSNYLPINKNRLSEIVTLKRGFAPSPGACRGLRREAPVSPTFSATAFSPTVGATLKILSATPNFEAPKPSVYKHYLYGIQVGNFTAFLRLETRPVLE